MNFKAFMLENTENEIVEYVASERFKDEEGNVIPWKLKALTSEDEALLQKKYLGGKGDIDSIGYLREIVTYTIYEPDLTSEDLRRFYKVKSSEALLYKLLPKPKEYANLVKKVQEVNGIDKQQDEIIEDSKN